MSHSKFSPGVCSRCLVFLIFFQAITQLPAPSLAQEGDVRRVHDPHIIKEADSYYIFCTGFGIPIRQSSDLINWKKAGKVFDKVPAWAKEEIPRAWSLWAPDILFFNGKYHLYYSVSTFGKNRSCIGLVTNTTLDPQSKDYKWDDQGKVVESTNNDDFNAIDANPVMDDKNNPWLCFGSFWGGIKMRRLDINTGKTSADDTKLYSLASRPEPKAIEGAYIFRKGDYYYLFVSFDFCCKGVKSNYNIRVGRSKQITGPYVDKSGTPMLEGGGTLVLEGAGRYIGPGHNSILHDGDKDWLVYHFYDGENRGIATLQIRPLTWTEDGWPIPGEPLKNPAPPQEK
ncbi:MAG: arabinan endo-1,5-alpha-L-arabinosidase [Thermoguttaceae bacterium]|jgi:arabinan endo-1,5-alpha-L-arabinosidase